MEMIKENYALIWNETVPQPGTYKFGERKQHQFIEFLTKTKFSNTDWEYWMDQISSKPWNKLEQNFITQLIEHRFIVRKVVIMNSITESIESEGKIINQNI